MSPNVTRDGNRSCTAPLVGITVPCYNRVAFLFECLNSLIAQTEPRWEAVVVDDCSDEDAIERIVASYRDPRLRYIRHEHNRGLAASRNTAFRLSKAPYLLCLDADDFLHPEFLEATIPVLHQQARDCVYTEFQLIGLSNEIWRWKVKTADDMAEAQWIPGSGTLMHRSVWERVGGFCEDNVLRVGNEDWDFWIGAITRGITAEHIAKPLYYYRRHEHSMSVSTLTLHDWKTREFIVVRHPQFFAKKDRMTTFLSGGYWDGAQAQFRSRHYGVCARLVQKAVATNPALLVPVFKTLFSFVLRRVFRKGLADPGRKVLSWITQQGRSNAPAQNPVSETDWDASAIAIHQQYGHLSHDYRLLDEIISATASKSILDIGCGSGRLIPIYLKQGIELIWAQDVSSQALDICRQRFHCQTGIRYFNGSIHHLPNDCEIDLVVSVRALQHIKDDNQMWRALNHIAPRTKNFFINELTTEDVQTRQIPDAVGRDYVSVFTRLGFNLGRQGKLIAEDGSLQHWMLFVKGSNFKVKVAGAQRVSSTPEESDVEAQV